ncbi:hypothetical protein VC82_820 [Flagellimonas lutaonensis]|uniref:Uncharacterized protein n=2 Tax=Flagellimonas lutaonensis TaxID=516051 RepID=A0A0D5YQ90_9FLAO|nr:hypothetical protein VC82_820 [Allomuricauda lutaonensis]
MMLLGLLALLAVAAFIFSKTQQKTEPQPQMASMNFIKCTVAKFMLTDVDTTQSC